MKASSSEAMRGVSSYSTMPVFGGEAADLLAAETATSSPGPSLAIVTPSGERSRSRAAWGERTPGLAGRRAMISATEMSAISVRGRSR